jgi:cytochrome c
VLANAEFTWTPRALDAWLAQPARFLPGNLMSFPGVRDPAARDDLIAYLLKVTAADQAH